MKKLFYTLLAASLLLPAIASAQKITITSPKIWTVPSIYALDEEVTWFFDFNESPEVSAGQSLYLWTWSPGTPSDPNTPVLLKDEGEKVWSLTMVPTTFYRMTADQILNNNETFFWFNIRGDEAAAISETGTLQISKKDYIKEFVDSGKRMAYSPADFWLNTTLSILFNANTVEGFLPTPSTVHMHGSANSWTFAQGFDAWLPDIRVKTQFKDMGNGIYKKDLVPMEYFPGVTEETDLQNITFVVAKYNGNDATPDWAGTAGAEDGDFWIYPLGAPIPVPPKFYLFPMKVSPQDILIISRDNNESSALHTFTLTDGSKTVSGEMPGTKSRQRAFVNLAAEFSGTAATSLHLVVKNPDGRVIYEGDIPFVKADNITK